jgi:hypothetical protein
MEENDVAAVVETDPQHKKDVVCAAPASSHTSDQPDSLCHPDLIGQALAEFSSNIDPTLWPRKVHDRENDVAGWDRGWGRGG